MVGTKVIVGESVAKQHRIVVSAIMIWTKATKLVKRIKWWKLKRLESEEQIQNGSDYKRNTWCKGRLAKSS